MKNWCFWTVVLKKTLESPLDCKAIQPVHPKDQSWVFIGRTAVEAETSIVWPPDAKSWLSSKDPDARKDWGQEEKGTTEKEMVGRHHRLNGHGFGCTPWVGDGQGGLVCCGSWGHKESNTTERLNWTEINVLNSLSSKFILSLSLSLSISAHLSFIPRSTHINGDRWNIISIGVKSKPMGCFLPWMPNIFNSKLDLRNIIVCLWMREDPWVSKNIALLVFSVFIKISY